MSHKTKFSAKQISKRFLTNWRKERRSQLTVQQLLKRHAWKEFVLSRPKDSKLSKHFEKYEANDIIQGRALELYGRYNGKVAWSACVQAVKTDHVSEFHVKYSDRLK